ncbi:hypothetical protein IFR05_016030 [Cadophora sp. M221]|nr:hypothetical protein IFR05_016030 [Cadophora sp. M221]
MFATVITTATSTTAALAAINYTTSLSSPLLSMPALPAQATGAMRRVAALPAVHLAVLRPGRVFNPGRASNLEAQFVQMIVTNRFGPFWLNKLCLRVVRTTKEALAARPSASSSLASWDCRVATATMAVRELAALFPAADFLPPQGKSAALTAPAAKSWSPVPLFISKSPTPSKRRLI